MAQEIERARGLLTALIRDKVLAAEDATKAYEAWVSSGDESPFSRFLVDLFPARGEPIRAALRLQAVTGMPHPERFTFERFEDLLVGQLGIEAGMVSPKLLQTVRAVQDKKVKENKLRRLDDLLPRAGFDPKMLTMLYGHLRERVLICKGCLGRFPRQEMGAFAIECPRCDYNMLADALEPSDVKQLSDEQRMMLMASSEAVMETVSIQERQLRREERQKKGSDKAAGGVLVGLLAVLGGVVVVIGLLLNREKPRPIVKKTSGPKTHKTAEGEGGKTSSGGSADKQGLSLAEVRTKDLELYKRGAFAELLELWKQVEVQSGESAADVKQAQDSRVRRLEQLQELAKRAEELAAQLTSDPQQELELARLLGEQEVAINVPPFDRLKRELSSLREQRQERQREAAKQRYAEVLKQTSADAWVRRNRHVKRQPALMGVAFGGRRVDGVRVLEVREDGYEVQTPTGEAQSLEWGDQPVLDLRVMQAAAEAGEASDQLEVLRRALIARNPVVANQAMEKVPGRLSLATLIARAPSSVLPSPRGDGTYWVRYPTDWSPADFEPDRGSRVSSQDGQLVLSGNPCRVVSRPLPANAPERKEKSSLVYAEVTLAESVPGLNFALRLVGKGTEKSYVARWGGGRWSLELSLGSGRNKLKSGPLRSDGRQARISYDGREVTLALDGFPVFTKATTARVEEVGFAIGASEELRIESLELVGTLAPERNAAAERRFRNRVHQEVDAISIQADGGGKRYEFPLLSAEDPQALAVFGPGRLEALRVAKQALLSDELASAAAKLDALIAEAPGFAAAHYYRAYLSLLRSDPCQALSALERALEIESSFVEARALRGLAYAMSARGDLAEEDLSRASSLRPDLPSLYLAQAWTELTNADLSQRPSGAIAAQPIRVAQALANGDPLILRQGRALISLERLARSLPTRESSDSHLVLARGSLDGVEDLLGFLDHTLRKEIEPHLPRLSDDETGRFVRVAVLPNEYSRLVGDDRRAAYVHGMNLVILAEPLQEPTRDLLRALTQAHLVQRLGPVPAWLEEGICETLIRRVTRRPDPDKVDLLKGNQRLKDEDLVELLDADREVLFETPLLRARAWALVDGLLPKGQLKTLMRKIAEGAALDAKGSGIDVGSLPERYRAWVRRLKRPK